VACSRVTFTFTFLFYSNVSLETRDFLTLRKNPFTFSGDTGVLISL